MNEKARNQKSKVKKSSGASGVDMARAVGSEVLENLMLPPRVIRQIAEEVGKVLSKSITHRKGKRPKSNKKIDNTVFLDTSAIIDMRVFDLAKIGALYGNFIGLESVLSELKNIADSKDSIKKERGRRAMDALEKFKKTRGIKLIIMQYPTLDIDELKRMFKGDEGIIFVSNEENFKEALKSSPYEEYFVDRERGSFGHATKKGNQLIAENVAQVIKN